MVQEFLLKSFWDQLVFILANDIYTGELKASALTHLSRIWLITVACLMHPMRTKENVHRIIGYGCSCNLHQSYVNIVPRKCSS